MKQATRTALYELAEEGMPYLVERMFEEFGEGIADRLEDVPDISDADPKDVADIFIAEMESAMSNKRDEILGIIQYILEEFVSTGES